MKARNCFTGLLTLATIILILSGCNLAAKKTTISIEDPVRHYYPILRGQILDIKYVVKNTGKNPLFITDIYTSCGCIVVEKTSFKVLPSGGKGFIILKYDSSKNIGLVQQYVTIFGNLEGQEMYEVTFDVNVVPNALYTHDYEELYIERKEKLNALEIAVDGHPHERGYYTNK